MIVGGGESGVAAVNVGWPKLFNYETLSTLFLFCVGRLCLIGFRRILLGQSVIRFCHIEGDKFTITRVSQK